MKITELHLEVITKSNGSQVFTIGGKVDGLEIIGLTSSYVEHIGEWLINLKHDIHLNQVRFVKDLDKIHQVYRNVAQALADEEDKTILEKLLARCDQCGELKPISELILVTGLPIISTADFKKPPETRIIIERPRLECRAHHEGEKEMPL